MTVLTNSRIGYILLVLALFITQCDSTESNPEPDFNLIASTEVDGYNIELYSESNFITGANELHWRVTKSEKTVDIRSFEITPMMDMGMMQHSTPFTQPVVSDEFPSYFKNDATFIMSSGEMGSWSINFSIETKNNEQITGSIDINVESSWHLTSVKNENDEMFFICWNSPKEPVNGSNDVTFMLYKRENMMSFPMVMDATIEIYPYMDMGAGQGHSTSFENPTMNNDGKYQGNITYSMSGTWTTTVTITTGQNETLPDIVFEYNVKSQ